MVIRDTAHLAAVWKDSVALSFDPFIFRVLLAFGISAFNVEKMLAYDPGSLIVKDKKGISLLLNSNPRKKNYIHMQSEWFKQQLLPGEHLVTLQNAYLVHLRKALDLDLFNADFVVPSTTRFNFQAPTVSLRKFTRYVLSHCAFRTFFGEELFEVEPHIARLYQKWEDDSWKVVFNYPHFLTKDLHAARLQAIKSLIRYFKLPLDRRTNMAWLMGTMDSELKSLDFNDTDRAGMIMMAMWG